MPLFIRLAPDVTIYIHWHHCPTSIKQPKPRWGFGWGGDFCVRCFVPSIQGALHQPSWRGQCTIWGAAGHKASYLRRRRGDAETLAQNNLILRVADKMKTQNWWIPFFCLGFPYCVSQRFPTPSQYCTKLQNTAPLAEALVNFQKQTHVLIASEKNGKN